MISNDYIEIETPRLYAYIGAKFTISGWVHLSFFDSEFCGQDRRMFIDYLGLDVKTFMGCASTPIIEDSKIKRGKVRFSISCELSSMNIGFIEKSHGRITVKIDGPNKKIPPVYLPLIVKQFEDKNTNELEIIRRHSKVGEVEMKYEKDLKEYFNEMNKVYDSRKKKDCELSYDYLYNEATMMASDIFQILEEDGDEKFEEYEYSDEDQKEKDLEEKYKDALEWQGPLIGGVVSKFNGFELRVHSDDHDKHFHVIHKGKCVDARFSFPDMNLINYKNTRNTISSKAEKKIKEYCLRPEIFEKFKEEFNKREKM